ncbi:MAG: plastocyanin/azurin family copper-binding protein [Longimicrobiales bacterium]
MHEIVIRDFKYVPDTVRAEAGDSVRWRNDDLFAHTATSETRAWDTGPMGQGAHGQAAFGAPGSHTYFCTLHPNMRGVIVVQ